MPPSYLGAPALPTGPPGDVGGCPGPGAGEVLAQSLQEVTGVQAAEAHGIRLEVVKLPEAKRGFVLLPRRWVVERTFAWAARFRRLVRDYERLPETLAGLHFLALMCLMLKKALPLLALNT